jgi:hypothetical protein
MLIREHVESIVMVGSPFLIKTTSLIKMDARSWINANFKEKIFPNYLITVGNASILKM